MNKISSGIVVDDSTLVVNEVQCVLDGVIIECKLIGKQGGGGWIRKRDR